MKRLLYHKHLHNMSPPAVGVRRRTAVVLMALSLIFSCLENRLSDVRPCVRPPLCPHRSSHYITTHLHACDADYTRTNRRTDGETKIKMIVFNFWSDRWMVVTMWNSSNLLHLTFMFSSIIVIIIAASGRRHLTPDPKPEGQRLVDGDAFRHLHF